MSNTSPECIEATLSGIMLHVYAAPRSSSNKVMGVHNGMLKIALTAPPVEGAANKALVEFLAKTLGVPRSSIVLIAGETSRKKTISVKGIGIADAVRLLGVQ